MNLLGIHLNGLNQSQPKANIQTSLTVGGVGVQNHGRVPDQENPLGPHGQRTYNK